MTTRKQFRRRLRFALAAPWCALILLLCTAEAGHFFDVNRTTHEPTEPLSLNSANVTGPLDWSKVGTGTLPDARLSGNVPLLDGTQNLIFAGNLINGAVVTGQVYSNGGDPSIDLSNPATGVLRDDGGACLEWSYDGVNIDGALSLGGVQIANGSGHLTPVALQMDDWYGNSLYADYGGLAVANSSGAVTAVGIGGFTFTDTIMIGTTEFTVSSVGNISLSSTGGGQSGANLHFGPGAGPVLMDDGGTEWKLSVDSGGVISAAPF